MPANSRWDLIWGLKGLCSVKVELLVCFISENIALHFFLNVVSHPEVFI